VICANIDHIFVLVFLLFVNFAIAWT